MWSLSVTMHSRESTIVEGRPWEEKAAAMILLERISPKAAT